MPTKVEVGNGKYTFIVDGYSVDILRYGEPWVTGVRGSNAIHTLVHEHHDLLQERDTLKIELQGAGQRLKDLAKLVVHEVANPTPELLEVIERILPKEG